VGGIAATAAASWPTSIPCQDKFLLRYHGNYCQENSLKAMEVRTGPEAGV